MTRLETLKENIEKVLGDQVTKLSVALNEITIECAAKDLIKVVKKLRDHKSLKFEQLIDLCGVDYQDYADGTWEGLRFATVYHFLSVTLNHRIRLKVFSTEDDFPVLPTLVEIGRAHV